MTMPPVAHATVVETSATTTAVEGTNVQLRERNGNGNGALKQNLEEPQLLKPQVTGGSSDEALSRYVVCFFGTQLHCGSLQRLARWRVSSGVSTLSSRILSFMTRLRSSRGSSNSSITPELANSTQQAPHLKSRERITANTFSLAAPQLPSQKTHPLPPSASPSRAASAAVSFPPSHTNPASPTSTRLRNTMISEASSPYSGLDW
jgi:hypothetical protein